MIYYTGRKLKKRSYRQLWIQRINAAVRQFSLPYNTFINATQHYNVQCKLDRKMLSELAVNEPNSFKAVVDTVKEHGEVPEKYVYSLYYIILYYTTVCSIVLYKQFRYNTLCMHNVVHI